MNVYTIYAELADGVKPNEFVERITEYFATLCGDGGGLGTCGLSYSKGVPASSLEIAVLWPVFLRAAQEAYVADAVVCCPTIYRGFGFPRTFKFQS